MENFEVMSEPELAILLKSGNHGAFSEIYTRFNASLFAFAYKKIGDKEEAKDVVQEIFIKLWQNRAFFELKISLPSYLYRAISNRALDIFAHKKIKDSYVSRLQTFVTNNAEQADYLIREKDIQNLIAAEIALLPPKMQEVFKLSREMQLSHKEIARELSISEETVKVHMKRALQMLRKTLKALFFLPFHL